MKLGVCIKTEELLSQYPILTDYVEISADTLWAMENEAFNVIKNGVREEKIKIYSVKNLIRGQRLTGPDADLPTLREYIEKLFYRLAELDIGMIVFGSGKAKDVPEGFSREKAWEQLYEFGNMLSEEGSKYGQTIAVEPLAYRETNILNTVEEAVDYIKVINKNNFKYLVDFFHFDYNKEDYSVIEKNADDLVHVHFASQVIRRIPVTDEDWSFVEKWMRLLKKIGYDGAVSFEGGYHPAEPLNNMLVKLKEIEKKVDGLKC